MYFSVHVVRHPEIDRLCCGPAAMLSEIQLLNFYI